tara:strand:+ start:1159 stop:1635 length:477 start_codon:yes stop_codon:yes gene_type:complete
MLNIGPMLERFKVMLASEERHTIKMQFNNFLYDSLSHSPSQEDGGLYEEFEMFLKLLENDKMKQPKKIVKIMESPFIHYIISFKPNAREKELRRLTQDLSGFIASLGHHQSKNPHYILATSMKEAAEIIQPRKNKGSKESMNEAWRRNLQDEVVKRFK